MKKKKILIFSLAYFPDHIGGAEIAIREITDRTPDIEFHLITLRFHASEPVSERIGNVHVHRAGRGHSYLSKMSFIPFAALEAMRLHRAERFDAAWAMMSYMSLPLVLLAFLGIRIPYVLSLQDGDPFEHVFKRWYIRPFLPFLRIGFRRAAVIQTISTFLSRWVRILGAPHAEIIPNGVDTRHFAQEYPQAEIDAIKDRLGKNMDDIFIITTSRLVRKNAVDDVIHALPMLPQNAKFLILGTGPDEAALKALAHEAGVADRVRFLGQIGHDELPKYLKASDIFIRPSRSEGMGNSFVEAMAAGLPVIATQEGGIADFLFDEKRNPDKPVTGWAVDVDSPDQIVAAVSDIMARSEKVRAVTATARQMVIEKYDWDLVAKDMREKVFGRVLG